MRCISHPSKVTLKIILNRLKPQAEKIIAEKLAGFRARRSTTEKIVNLRILYENYLQHQQDLYHVFIDYKKAFDKVWHAALREIMKKYNISTNVIQVIENLYNKATSAVLFKKAWATGSEQQLESDRDVYSHPPSSIYFWKGSRQTP